MKPPEPSETRPRQTDHPGGGAAPVFNQPGQAVAQQWNANRDINIHHPAPPAIPIPTTRAEAIRFIEREFGQDLRTLDRCYVMPDFQL